MLKIHVFFSSILFFYFLSFSLSYSNLTLFSFVFSTSVFRFKIRQVAAWLENDCIMHTERIMYYYHLRQNKTRMPTLAED